MYVFFLGLIYDSHCNQKVKEVSMSVQKLNDSLKLITKKVKYMKLEFERHFNELILIYKEHHLEVMKITHREASKEYLIANKYDPDKITEQLHDIFFKHLISFYDRFSSKINYRIYNHLCKRKKHSELILKKICSCVGSFHFKSYLSYETVETTQYPSFEYFVLRLQEIAAEKLCLDITFIRFLLYGGYDMYKFYNTMELWRRCNGVRFQSVYSKNDDSIEVLDVKDPVNTDQLNYFSARFSFDIINEYRQEHDPENDIRFKLFNKMIRKYDTYDLIPGITCNSTCKCSEVESGKKCNGERMRAEYFEYIDYYFQERGYSRMFKRLISNVRSIILCYNSRIQRDTSQKYNTPKRGFFRQFFS
ncbi:hypothetical protein CDIK_0764 [Cucumispora dikerogammari]|nr:hypothetical protein CDIK_0764 [Cucumispora dikerogammari]